jgi:hypothetical protein
LNEAELSVPQANKKLFEPNAQIATTSKKAWRVFFV